MIERRTLSLLSPACIGADVEGTAAGEADADAGVSCCR